MDSTVLCLLYFTVTSVQVALASHHTVRFTFHRYLNPNNGSVLAPDCCDRGPVSQTCYSPCETIIKICLENIGDDTMCSLTQTQSSGIIASSDIKFGTTVGTLPNPVDFHLDTIPQEGMQAYILIEDDDLGPFDDDPLTNTIDMIDEIFVIVSGGGDPTIQTYTGSYNIAQLDLEYEVVCDYDYYGADCSTFCVPMNDNVNGHFTCHPATGAKVCLNNYINPATNCLQSIVQPTEMNPTTSTDLHTEVNPTTSTGLHTEMNPTTSTGLHTEINPTTSTGLRTSSTFSTSTYDLNMPATQSKTTTDIMSGKRTHAMGKETVNPGGNNRQTAVTSPSASTTNGATDTSTGKNNFGIMAGVVGSIALAMALSLGLIVICMAMFVFRRHKNSQAKAASGRGPSGGDFVVINDPSIDAAAAGCLANPVYSGVNLASYQELQPQTMIKKGVYMTLDEKNRSQKHNTDTKLANAITTKDNVQYDSAVKTVTPNMRPIVSNSKQQDYACLYETPIDGAMLTGQQIFTVLQPEATKTSTDYQEPADSITPCGQILISMESTIPVQ